MSVDLERLIQDAIAVKQQYLDKLFAMPNVVGIGIGFKVSDGVVTNELAITINVSKKIPTAQLAASDLIPKLIGSIKTDVVETGIFQGVPGPQAKDAPGAARRFHRALSTSPPGRSAVWSSAAATCSS